MFLAAVNLRVLESTKIDCDRGKVLSSAITTVEDLRN